MIQETPRENAVNSSTATSPQLLPHNMETLQSRHHGDSSEPAVQLSSGSPDFWPKVTEPAYEVNATVKSSSDRNLTSQGSMRKEHTAFLQNIHSDQITSSHSLAKKIMDGNHNIESPAPPPPSPEPKENSSELLDSIDKQELQSQDSMILEPLIEQTELEMSVSAEKIPQQFGQHQDSSAFQNQSAVEFVAEPVPAPFLVQYSKPEQVTFEHEFGPVTKMTTHPVMPVSSDGIEEIEVSGEDPSSLKADQYFTLSDNSVTENADDKMTVKLLAVENNSVTKPADDEMTGTLLDAGNNSVTEPAAEEMTIKMLDAGNNSVTELTNNEMTIKLLDAGNNSATAC